MSAYAPATSSTNASASATLRAGDANWLVPDPPESGERVGVRVRHGAPIVDGRVTERGDGEFALELRTAQRAVTPGQSAVLYRDDVVLGGGVIWE